MPIPPRPIPASNRPSTSTRMRPGSSVPRKSLQSLDKLDWRSEISLLHDTHSRSLPPSSGVKVVDQIKEQTAKATEGYNGAVEVGIEGLIEEGKGKREKRATTATTLGFDFVSNPTVIALPDATPTPAKPTIAGRVEHQGRASPTLTNTPSTPGLLATRRSPLGRSDSEDDLEDDDDDWEHINALDNTNLREEQLEDDGSQSEEDVIVLGELELEDEFDLADHRRAERHASKTPITGVVPYLGETVKPKRSTSGKGETRGISYAAILGGTVHEGR